MLLADGAIIFAVFADITLTLIAAILLSSLFRYGAIIDCC